MSPTPTEAADLAKRLEKAAIDASNRSSVMHFAAAELLRSQAAQLLEKDAEIERLKADKRSVNDAVGCGMVIAAAIIVRVWGDEVQAEEILGAGGIETLDKMRAAGVDAYDAIALKNVLRTIKNRKPRQARAALEPK